MEQRIQDLLHELRDTKLPRHHRDAEDNMQWAADLIEDMQKRLDRWEPKVTGFTSAMTAAQNLQK